MYESFFETFLKTASHNDKKAADERVLVEAMKGLPPDVLFKIANGEMKLGSMVDCGPSKTGGPHNLEWLEEFKDTPFFEQALQLEQQAINIEMMRQQSQSQHDAERKEEPNFYDMEDRIRLQKRLLGLQLASTQLQAQGGGMPGAMPGGAGPVPPGPAAPPPSVPEGAGGGAPSPTDGKVAFDHAAMMGQRMAQSDYDRAVTMNTATAMGQDLAKVAFDLPIYNRRPLEEERHNAKMGLIGSAVGGGLGGGLAGAAMAHAHGAGIKGTIGGGLAGAGLGALSMAGGNHLGAQARIKRIEEMEAAEKLEKKALDMGGLANMGRQAVGAVAAHPGAAIGAAAGGAAGLAHGMQRDAQGQRHIMSGLAQGAVGAAGGAAIGHVAQGAQALHAGGLGLGESVSTAAGALKNQVQSGVQNAASRVMGKPNPAAMGQAQSLAHAPAPTVGMSPSTMPMTGAAPPMAAPTSSGVRTAVQGRVVPQGAPPGPPVAAP